VSVEQVKKFCGTSDFFSDLANAFIRELKDALVYQNTRQQILEALITAASRAAGQPEVEARVWLNPSELEFAQYALQAIGRRFFCELQDKEKSTRDTLELLNGSAIVLQLKELG
jgi:hypothetical protein